jgi:hypothetical protein
MKISSQIHKKLNLVQKAIDVPLMDTTNVANLIVDTLVSKNKHFVFDYNLQLYCGIPIYIQAIVLAENEYYAFEILKLKLNTINVDASCCYNPDLTFEDVLFEEFDIKPLYNNEYTVLCEPRIDYLFIDQGYWDGSTSFGGLRYTLCEYKYKCKPQKEFINIFKNKNDYFDCHYSNVNLSDERIESEYSEKNIETAQSCIQYLF